MASDTAATPTAAYSVRLRVRLPNVPGALGRLSVALGEIGANIVGLHGFEAKGPVLDEDVVVNCTDAAHIEAMREALARLDGVEILDFADRTFEMHAGGKIHVLTTVPIVDRDDLSMAYTPGVARICTAIATDPRRAHDLTIKKNTVAIVTDGTAVLGLGNIGPEAALPVMEGKAMLFKSFADVDAFPVCIDTSAETTPEDKIDAIVDTVLRIAPVYGGVNLEDIAAPACFEVERRLRERLDIPVFHDDQHGTAVVTLAALENALKVVGKHIDELRVVISGAGAAGVAIAKILMAAGVPDVVGCDSQGVVHAERDDLNSAKRELAEITNPRGAQGTLAEALAGADVFIGVSGPDLLVADDLRKMATDPVVFAMANPDPEIRPEIANGLVAVMATGRSDYPNQINNVLAFPGIFRGALDAGATTITEGMKVAAADAIAAAVSKDDLGPECIVPSVFDRRVVELVAAAVAGAAVTDRVCRDF
jgi:malate dehydrogenase (oxaloacetate-decarboxylating)